METLLQSKMSSLSVIAVVAFLWLGCAASSQVEKAENKSIQEMQKLQQQSVGKIPCRPYEIEVSEFKINKADGSGYWIAYCLGKTYRCVRGSKDHQDVTCEQIPPQGME